MQKFAQKLADNKFLSKLPFIDNFVKSQIPMIEEKTTPEEATQYVPNNTNNLQESLSNLAKDDKDINYSELSEKTQKKEIDKDVI